MNAEDPAPELVTQNVEGSKNVAVASGGGNAVVIEYPPPPPIDWTPPMRDDVAYALAQLEGKNVLYARLDDELWRFVFESLRGLRQVLMDTSAKLRTRGPNDVKATLQFMVKAVAGYLSVHEANYTRYLSDHGGWDPGWAHVERDWLLSVGGRPADDLLLLRAGLDQAIHNLNNYADTGKELEWREAWVVNYWAEWAHERLGSSAVPARDPSI